MTTSHPTQRPRHVASMDREHPLDLSANENPLGPSPLALAAMLSAMRELHRYPDRACTRLKSALAERLGVTDSQIAVGNGSCEVLDLAVRSLVRPGETVILGTPGFPAYQGAVQRAGGSARVVPAKAYQDDLEAMLEQIDASTRLVLLGNPANPTGTITARAALLGFLDRLPEEITLVIDEAYRDFVDAPDFPDAVELVRSGRPVVALRSFSKAQGLAGLRVGYAVAAPALIARLDAGHQQFNTGTLAQAAALAALEDDSHVRATIALNRRGRAELLAGLSARGLAAVPSQASFVLFRVGDGAPAMVRRLAARGVLVKGLDRYGLPDHIRVSSGSPWDQARFFAALDEVLELSDDDEEGATAAPLAHDVLARAGG